MWCVYIIDKNRLLYTGITQDLKRRIQEHHNESQTVKLLYHEEVADKFQAAKREKQIKGWTRKKKMALIAGDMNLLKRL